MLFCGLNRQKIKVFKCSHFKCSSPCYIRFSRNPICLTTGALLHPPRYHTLLLIQLSVIVAISFWPLSKHLVTITREICVTHSYLAGLTDSSMFF